MLCKVIQTVQSNVILASLKNVNSTAKINQTIEETAHEYE